MPSRLPTLFGDGDGDGVASQPVLLGGKQDTRERACRRSQRQSNSRGPQATLHNRRFVTRSAGGVCRSLHGLGGCLVRPALFIMISWPRSRRYLGANRINKGKKQKALQKQHTPFGAWTIGPLGIQLVKAPRDS